MALQMLEASLYVAEHLPDGATGLWGLIHCESFSALGELEWIPFPVLRKALDVNVLGEVLNEFSVIENFHVKIYFLRSISVNTNHASIDSTCTWTCYFLIIW